MAKFSEYKIPLRSLSDGKHEFKYHLDNNFFKLIDDGAIEVRKGDLNVTLEVRKSNNTFELNFNTVGTLRVPCDRCLDEIIMNVDTQNKLIVKFGSEYSEESDEIVIIPEEDGEINIAWFLYEFIVLSLPIKRVHPPGECNKTMSSKLKKYRPTPDNGEDDTDDLDDDDSDSDNSSFNDPRWDTLKDINFDED